MASSDQPPAGIGLLVGPTAASGLLPTGWPAAVAVAPDRPLGRQNMAGRTVSRRVIDPRHVIVSQGGIDPRHVIDPNRVVVRRDTKPVRASAATGRRSRGPASTGTAG
jgi:hypothetical protein